MTESAKNSLMSKVIVCAAFINGFAIMAIELLGGRVLSPYFGTSVYVWGSIITIFMLSLSLGYLWGGRLSSRNPNPYTFAMFFLLAAVAAKFHLLSYGLALVLTFIGVKMLIMAALGGAGLLLCAHAGEEGPPAYIEDALDRAEAWLRSAHRRATAG